MGRLDRIVYDSISDLWPPPCLHDGTELFVGHCARMTPPHAHRGGAADTRPPRASDLRPTARGEAGRGPEVL
jgi:hypothetical protein